ncbi:MAG: hypothetical protein JNL11_01490 [Bdellovibrionaceae bacterium]|nr:hypothetical protein [Pseudobdellovibrionaceae bacterium]
MKFKVKIIATTISDNTAAPPPPISEYSCSEKIGSFEQFVGQFIVKMNL